MKVTKKGRVTIPVSIRKKYGFTPGTDVDFLRKGDRVFLMKRKGTVCKTRQLSELRGVANVQMTTDEIMALTRDK